MCFFFNDVLVWFECDDLSAQKEFSKSENTVEKLSILTSMSHLQLLVVENCLMFLFLSVFFLFFFIFACHHETLWTLVDTKKNNSLPNANQVLKEISFFPSDLHLHPT